MVFREACQLPGQELIVPDLLVFNPLSDEVFLREVAALGPLPLNGAWGLRRGLLGVAPEDVEAATLVLCLFTRAGPWGLDLLRRLRHRRVAVAVAVLALLLLGAGGILHNPSEQAVDKVSHDGLGRSLHPFLGRSGEALVQRGAGDHRDGERHPGVRGQPEERRLLRVSRDHQIDKVARERGRWEGGRGRGRRRRGNGIGRAREDALRGDSGGVLVMARGLPRMLDVRLMLLRDAMAVRGMGREIVLLLLPLLLRVLRAVMIERDRMRVLRLGVGVERLLVMMEMRGLVLIRRDLLKQRWRVLLLQLLASELMRAVGGVLLRRWLAEMGLRLSLRAERGRLLLLMEMSL